MVPLRTGGNLLALVGVLLTPDGLPLALVRRAAQVLRMARAAADPEERGEAVTSRVLEARSAHLSRAPPAPGGSQRETGAPETDPLLSVLQ